MEPHRRSLPCDCCLRCAHYSSSSSCPRARSLAQSSPTVSSAPVPRLINISGVFRPADGQPAAAVETVTLSIYADPEGGRRCGRRRRPSRRRPGSLHAAARRDPGRTAFRPRCLAPATPVAGHCVRARRRSRRAARPDYQRAVCAARRPTPTRSAGGRPRRTCSPPRRRTAPRTRSAAAVEAARRRAPISCLPGTTNFLAKYVNGGADVGSSGGLRDAEHGASRDRHDDAARSPARALHQHQRRFTGLAVQNMGGTARPPIPACCSTTTGRAGAVPGLQQQHPRIPDQQHRLAGALRSTS